MNAARDREGAALFRGAEYLEGGVSRGKNDTDFGSFLNSVNYQKMFGPTYYSFTLGTAYFIVTDISTEYMANTVAQKKYFDNELKWLESELKKSLSYKDSFVFSHVPPFKGKKALKGTQKDNPEKFLRNPGYSDSSACRTPTRST